MVIMAIDDATIAANQAQARSLGISIPGVGGGGPSSSLPPLQSSNAPSGATGAAPNDLQSYLSSNLDPYEQTIMGQYDASKSATSAAGDTAAKAISDTGNYNLGYQSDMDKAQGTSALESGRGFVVNPGQLSILQEQSTKRIRDLTTQMNDALANNNTAVASKLADLALQENTAITNARTTFLNQYFQGKQEQRAEQSFQTPQQTAITSLISQYPDAGLSPNDDLATAQAKIRNSPSYKLNISKGETDITTAIQNAQSAATSASASATSANAARTLAIPQAQYQNIINGIAQGDPGSVGTMADQLIANQNDPTKGTTPEQLQSTLSQLPGGIGGFRYNQVIQAAQAKGYNQAGATLGNTAAETNTRSLSQGGFSTFGTGLTNLGSAFLKGAGGLNSSSLTTVMTGPGGTYQVPNSQVEFFKQNGYK